MVGERLDDRNMVREMPQEEASAHPPLLVLKIGKRGLGRSSVVELFLVCVRPWVHSILHHGPKITK